MIDDIRRANLSFWLLFLIVTTIMMIRAFYGIEITDEAYYLAEGRTVLEGNIPYALNNSNAVGMTLLMLPFVWIFKFISTEYVGYVLYMRICFILFKSILLLVSYYLLRTKIGSFYAACVSLVICAYHIVSIQNFSYNTISTMIIFMVGIILYLIPNSKNGPLYEKIGYFICGFLSAMAVFAHPAHAVSGLLFLSLLFIFNTKIIHISFYVVGGIVQIAILFATILILSGWEELFHGLLFYGKGVGGQRPELDTVIAIVWESYNQLWTIMAVVFILLIIDGLLVNHMTHRAYFKELRHTEWFTQKEIMDALYFSIFWGLMYIFLQCEAQYIMPFIGALCAFVIMILLFIYTNNRALWFLGMPFLCFCLFEGAMTVSNSPEFRFLFVVPAFSSLFAIAGERQCQWNSLQIGANVKPLGPFCNKSVMDKMYILPMIAVFLIVSCEIKALKYVYRDDGLTNLTYKVEQGVFKGIYTTEQRGKNTMDLEKFIKSVTDGGDYVAFRDNVPVGYLFMNGKICDIRTWDCMQYSYGRNDPSALYAYYERARKIPDKIIYVDFGRDKQLSVDDENFLYNIFLKEHYELQIDVSLNKTYKRVILYRRKGNDAI